METGDILTVAGGLFIVIIIALIANPQYLTGLQASLAGVTPTPTRTLLPLPAVTPLPATTAVLATAQTLTSSLTPAPPYRISYTDKPFSYPVIRLPDRVDTLGESDIRRSGQDIVTIAFVEDSRGGLTREFSVPYPVWSMDIRDRKSVV